MVCVIGSAPSASGSPTGSGVLSQKETDPNGYAASFGTMVMVYPVEYGGAYIDRSNNLHIVLSKYATNSTIDTYRSIIGDPDVIFEVAEFPLSRLYEIQDSILDAPFSFDTAGVNEIINRLEIHLPDSTKPEAVTEFFKNKFADFDERCITLLGPNPVTAGVEYIHPSTAPNDGFLGTALPTTYGAVAVAIVLVITALGCMLLGFYTAKGKAAG
jgi:hypothetical protein